MNAATVVRLAPRFPSAPSVSTKPLKPGTGPLIVLCGLFGLSVMLIALVSHGGLDRVALFLGGVLIVLLTGLPVNVLTANERGIVRVERGALRFVPRRRMLALSIVLAALAIAIGLIAVTWAVSEPTEQFGSSRRFFSGALVIGGLGLLYLGQLLFSLRRPRGLQLTEFGLTGVRGGPAVHVPWSLLAEARAVDSGRGLVLRLQLEAGSPITVLWQHIGSDPNLVATIIEHYRTHPDDRALLEDAVTAVQRAEQG